MKKIISLVICIVLCMSLASICFASQPVGEFEPYINGYNDGSVRPNGEIQRCEIAKILAIITNSYIDDGMYKINDVPKDNWAYKYIYGIVSYGIMDVDNVKIKSGEISPNKLIHAIYVNTNISETPTNLIGKSDYIDTLPNKDEIYAFVAAINKSANNLASLTGENIMNESGFKIDKFDGCDMNSPTYNVFTVGLFLNILKYGNYDISYDKIAADLGCSIEELSGDDIIKNADSEISANFRPNDKLTRIELAKSLYKILDGSYAQVYYNNAFSDITNLSDDDKIAINYLNEHGIIKGKSDGMFHPNDTITRAEVVVMINRAFGDKLKSKPLTREIPWDLKGHWAEQEFIKAMA